MDDILTLLNDPNYNYDTISIKHLDDAFFNKSLEYFEKVIYHPNFDNHLTQFSILYVCRLFELEKIKMVLDHPKNKIEPLIEIHDILHLINRYNITEIMNIFAPYPKCLCKLLSFDSNRPDYVDELVIHAFTECNLANFANLLESGFNPSSVNNKNETIIHILCTLKLIDLDILGLFLSHPDYDVNIMNVQSSTILNILCRDTLIDNDLKHQMIINILEHPHINDYCLNKTCLNDACRNENIKLVKLFLSDKRICPNKKNKTYTSPIKSAFATYNLELVKLFLEDPRVQHLSDDDIVMSLSNPKTPYNKSSTEIFNFLKFVLESSYEIHNPLIIQYINNNQKDHLKIILSFKNLIINISSYYPNIIKDYELLQILKGDGRFDSLVFSDGSTFYHFIFNGDVHDSHQIDKLNKLCLDWNIDPQTKNSKNQTPYHLMCEYGLYQSFIDAYEKYPIIDINMIGDYQNTLLHSACSDDQLNCQNPNVINERLKLIKFLIKHPSIDINMLDYHGNNIFHNICKSVQIPIIKFIMEEFDLPDHIVTGVNNGGDTPFNLLIYRQYHQHSSIINENTIQAMEYLLKTNRIDFSKLNRYGLTPFDHIYKISQTQQNHPFAKIVEYMIKNVDGIVVPDNTILEVD